MAKELSPPKGLAMAKENLLMLKKLALVKVMSKQADDYCVTIILRWLTTVLMEHKSTIFNSFEKGSKLFFPSLFNACSSLLPFYVKFEQLNVNKWPK